MAATLGAIQAATSLLLRNKDLSIDNWTFKLFYFWSKGREGMGGWVGE